MHYIKDLFEKNDTEHAHNKFVRYSKGEFVGPQIKIKVMKNGIKVNTSFHLIDELLMLMADYLKDREVEIKGTLAWNMDLAPDLAKIGIKYLKVTKSRGIFKYTLENKVRFKEFIDALGGYNLLISFKEEDISLSTKSTLPKPNKEVTNDFCKTTFPVSMTKKILSEFAFDIDTKGVKDINIDNRIIVDKIDIPEAETFEIARKLAKRGGKLKRIIAVDDKEPVLSEVDFYI